MWCRVKGNSPQTFLCLPRLPSPPLPFHPLPIQTALSLLEKDVLEKQATIVSLRKQLDEMKAVNVKMQGQLQVRQG